MDPDPRGQKTCGSGGSGTLYTSPFGIKECLCLDTSQRSGRAHCRVRRQQLYRRRPPGEALLLADGRVAGVHQCRAHSAQARPAGRQPHQATGNVGLIVE
jgi:hypothetical protein